VTDQSSSSSDARPLPPPEPSSPGQPGAGDENGLADAAAIPAPSRRRLLVMTTAVLAVLVVLGGGAFVYRTFIREDSGVAVCKDIRDGQVNPQPDADNAEMTQAEYRRIRAMFADSRHDDIRDHGTRLIDLVWQIQQLPKDDEMAALGFIGPLTTHVAGLQSACAEQGIVFNLFRDDATDSAAPSPDPRDEDAGRASAAPTEGSAASVEGRTVTFPDGIVLILDKVEQVPRNLGYEVPADHAILRVTWTFKNTTDQPVPLQPYTRYLTVLSGPNRVEGEAEAGYSNANPGEQLQEDQKATRVAPGGSVTMFESSTVPVADLGELAVRIQPVTATAEGISEPYTFADVQAILVKR
jgi:hypothetical protein